MLEAPAQAEAAPCPNPPAPPPGTAWPYQPCPYPQSPTYPDLPGVCHPYPQPWPKASTETTTGCPGKDCKTTVCTGEGIFPPSNPFNYETFPGTNFLPTVYTNIYDSLGKEIPNTLPSTPDIPYNLQDGDPVVSQINPLSPEDDLHLIFTDVLRLTRLDATERRYDEYDEGTIRAGLRRANDILEGNPIPDRVWSGFPLLHYTGPEKVRAVVPIKDVNGTVIGGNVDVHQVWFDQRIESDTAFIDLSAIKAANVPWTVTYTVDVLNRGRDDFSPYVMYMDPQPAQPGQPPPPPKPGIGMDQDFFDMEDGTRTVFRIKMAPPSFYNLVYTWGWRMHPPRAQVMENAGKQICYTPCPSPLPNPPPPPPTTLPPQSAGCPAKYQNLTLPQVEQTVFCMPDNPGCTSVRCAPGEPPIGPDGKPTKCEQQKLYAIKKIGDLAPEKQMWNAVREARQAADKGDWKAVTSIVRDEALPAYFDWLNRNQLPRGVKKWVADNFPDYKKTTDVLLLYVNNSTYGELTNGAWGRWDSWEERTEPCPGKPEEKCPKKLRVLVLNGDNFVHSYTIADFGGNRGWENQFKSSVKFAGSGCWFTFGRNWWWIPVGGPVNPYVCVAPTDDLTPSVHKFEIDLNFDPSRRLRFYQFDPFHHDVAIYSIH